MSRSIAEYVTLDVVQAIQHICAERLEFPIKTFDSDGRTNLVTPSNATALFGDYILRTSVGMRKCMESDRRGKEHIEEALRQSLQADGFAKDDLDKGRPLVLRSGLHHGGNQDELVGVAYLSNIRFLDFAVPIFDPASARGAIPPILSISYGGQCLRGDCISTADQEAAIDHIRQEIRQTANVVKGTPEERNLERLLSRIRQPSWTDISLRAHMLHVLGKAMARVGYEHWQTSRSPLSWSRDSILRIYAEAFKIASGASDMCLVGYDPWRDRMDVLVPCAGFSAEDCHREEGRLFQRLVNDPTLDYLFAEEVSKDQWHVGRSWVAANLVWAVRECNLGVKALVNLDFTEQDPRPTDLAMHLMRSLALQVGDFLNMEPLLSRRTTRESLQSQLAEVLGRLDEVDTVQQLCRKVASAVYGVYSHRPQQALTEKPKAERPSFQIWLTDGLDFSESQIATGRVLTCCAINGFFPHPEGRTHIPDVPFDSLAFKRLLCMPILTPGNLKKTYPELANNEAFGRGFSDMQDTDHLMIVPIRDEGASGKPAEAVKGLLVIIQPLTTYLTEEEHLVYEAFCERLAEAIDLVVERKKQQIALEVESMIGELAPKAVSHEAYDQLRQFLQEFVTRAKPKVGLIALSVFMREGWPFRAEQNAPIVLLAESNEFPLQNGKPVIKDRSTGQLIPWDQFRSVRYDVGSGYTGWAMTEASGDVARITHLREHEDGLLPGPRPSHRYDEAIVSERTRYGVIWAKLKSQEGDAVGIIRGCLRTDGLRLTQHDEEVIRGIANTLSRHTEAMVNRARLEQWGKELSTVAHYTKAIIELHASRRVPDAEKLSLSNWAVLLPIVSPEGLDIGRVQYCMINRNKGTIFADVGVGVARPTVGANVPADHLREKLKQFFASHPLSELTGESIAEMSRDLKRISLNVLPRLADTLQINATNEEIVDSVLGDALRSGEPRIVDPATGVLSRLDMMFLDAAQGTEQVKQPFVYVPMASPQLFPGQVQAFLYLDNAFQKDPAISLERARVIGTFVSTLSGLRASEQTSQSLRETLATIGHDIKNILIVSGAEESQVTMAIWRFEALQSLSYPVAKLSIERHLVESNPLHPVLQHVTQYIREMAKMQSTSVNVADVPETDKWFSGSAVLLEAVLWQLMDNALKFTAMTSGEKRIGIQIGEDCADDPGFIHLIVWDTGVGVRDEEKHLLGREWYRGERSAKGAGIGLLTCYKLLQQWTGRAANLQVRDHCPKGSEFHIWIPRATKTITKSGADSEV